LQQNNFKMLTDMEAVTFNQAQMHVLNLLSHIKSEKALDELKDQLAAFYAKQVDEEMDKLWSQESGMKRNWKNFVMLI